MFLLMSSTRHTKIGTLRRDHLYNLDDRNQAVREVVKAMTTVKAPAAKKLTEKEAEAHAKEVRSLIPKKEPEAKPKSIAAYKKAADEAEAKAAAAEAARIDAEKKLEAATAEIEALKSAKKPEKTEGGKPSNKGEAENENG